MNFRLTIASLFLFIAVKAALADPIDDLSLEPRVPSPAPSIQLPELEAASIAFKKGQLDDCIELLNAARQRTESAKAGELPPTNLMLARLHLSYGHTAKGKAMLEKVAVEHTEHPEVYLLFGNIAVSEGRWTDAMLHFERAQGTAVPSGWSPEQKVNLYRESFAGMARVSESREDWFRAQQALKQWSNIDPGNAGVRDRLAAALFMLGREREAFEQFQTSARQNSNVNEAEVSMAVMYARKQDFTKAREVFEVALQKYPRDGRVAYELSAMLLLSGNAAEAKTYSDKAAELGVDTPELIMQRGYIARQLKQYAEAESHFGQMLDRTPSHFEASNQLALVLIEQDDDAQRDRAVQLAELNVRRFPESSHALSTLGWVHYKLGNAAQAEQLLRVAASKGKTRTETLYYLLRVLWENGQKEDAQRVAERAKEAFDEPGLFVLRSEAKKWLSDEFVN
jgi:tetratricopeptide (TPR) repeat protein